MPLTVALRSLLSRRSVSRCMSLRLCEQYLTLRSSAVTYYDDMYVSFDLAQETAARIENIKQLITSEFQHTALRKHPKKVVDKLFALSAREVD
jgi:hypothetical protein